MFTLLSLYESENEIVTKKNLPASPLLDASSHFGLGIQWATISTFVYIRLLDHTVWQYL